MLGKHLKWAIWAKITRLQVKSPVAQSPILSHETSYENCNAVLTLGGSVVILMPTCRMEIGNSGWGLLLSHSLKSGWGSSTCSCSTSLSSCGIQLKDKWQLAKNTQLPCNNTYRYYNFSLTIEGRISQRLLFFRRTFMDYLHFWREIYIRWRK